MYTRTHFGTSENIRPGVLPLALDRRESETWLGYVMLDGLLRG